MGHGTSKTRVARRQDITGVATRKDADHTGANNRRGDEYSVDERGLRSLDEITRQFDWRVKRLILLAGTNGIPLREDKRLVTNPLEGIMKYFDWKIKPTYPTERGNERL